MNNVDDHWMPQAREIAAQCWCDEETSGIEMDARLAEAMARRIAFWMEESSRKHNDANYWRAMAEYWRNLYNKAE